MRWMPGTSCTCRSKSVKVHSRRPDPSEAIPGRSRPYASTFWPSRVTSLYPASPRIVISFCTPATLCYGGLMVRLWNIIHLCPMWMTKRRLQSQFRSVPHRTVTGKACKSTVVLNHTRVTHHDLLLPPCLYIILYPTSPDLSVHSASQLQCLNVLLSSHTFR